MRIEFEESGTGPVDDSGRPPGMRERTVSVTAREPWTDTNIEVRAGQVVYFTASGRVRWGPGRQDGAAGEHIHHTTDDLVLWLEANCPPGR